MHVKKKYFYDDIYPAPFRDTCNDCKKLSKVLTILSEFKALKYVDLITKCRLGNLNENIFKAFIDIQFHRAGF